LQNSDQAWLLVTPERGPKIWLERPEGDALGLKPDDRTTLLPRENGWRVIERIDQSRTPLWLFGAGHVGRALVRILADLPFAVTWIDSRQQEFPVAVPTEIDARISRRAAEEVAGAPHGTMFLVMTHSHELDFEICDRVLRRGDFAFLGLIGSATKRARFVHRFGEKGYNSAQLERLVCPIGLGDVPGKEPMAIAVAVAGQLLALRARLKAKLNEASPEAERGADIGAA